MKYLTVPLTQELMQRNQVDLQNLFNQLYGLNVSPAEVDIQHGLKFVHTKTYAFEDHEFAHEHRTWTTNIINQVEILHRRMQTVGKVYNTFHIPKASGGLREISAPSEELKDIQKELLHVLQFQPGARIPSLYPHDTAYAYIPGRSSKEALITHQLNKSKWFLKLDIKHFFPSTNSAFILDVLSKIYPFPQVTWSTITNLVDICTMNDVLPQGAPTSPLISNLVMLPYDKQISDALWNFNRHHFVYTRYADDLLISCRESFKFSEIVEVIKGILDPTPYVLNETKTRYGSSAGRNWNLGLMLNKDNKITLGHMKKKQLRAAVNNFFFDNTSGVTTWSQHDAQILIGELGYLKYVEPNSYKELIEKMEVKYNNTFQAIVKAIFNP